MHLDFDGRYRDHEPIGGSLRRWDGLLLSVGVHVAVILVILFMPLPVFLQHAADSETAAVPPPEQERPRFVFVQPKVDTPAPAPPQRAEMSDIDRRARNPEPNPAPVNPLPSARGDSANRVESAPEERARGRGPAPEPTPPVPEVAERQIQLPPEQAQMTIPKNQPQPPAPNGGSLGEALKNLQKYVEKETFNNPQGQTQDLGPLQFDTKGVEFGPWIRRFVSQVRRNWFVPYAAMTMRGRVVLTFNVHKNGSLTDVTVVQPSPVESFNTAAVNALLASNPTEPLPPEYPTEKAFFTVTFFYNDTPGGR
jgi:TonB family protein